MRRLALALSLTLAAPFARAALIPHTDLASTAYEASDVVRATWRSSRTDGGVRVGTYRVERVFTGGLAVGADVEVADGNVAEPQGTPPPDRYLALAPAVEGERRRLATSGMRVVIDGRVWRFEQRSNPGLEVPVPQGDALADGRGDASGAREGVTPARFEAMLADAIARAAALRELRTRWPADAPARMEALLLPAPARDTDGGYRDGFTLAAVSALFEHRRLDDGLALVARNAHDDGLRRALEGAVPVAELVARAQARERTSLRVAALRLLRAACTDGDPAADAVVALLADPDAVVREAAASNLGQVFHTTVSGDGAAAFAARRERIARGLLARFRAERDDSVRLAIATTLNAGGDRVRALPVPAGGPPLVYRAEASGDGVHVEAVCARPGARGEGAGVELVGPGGARVSGHTSYAYACAGARSAMNTGLVDGLSVGRYGIRLRLGRRAWPVGVLVVGADGTRRVE